VERTLTNLKVKLLEDEQPAYMIAAKCGMHPSQLTRYALGNETIKPGHLKALCRYFKCAQKELLGTATFVLEDGGDDA
jgi:hypothetical protein